MKLADYQTNATKWQVFVFSFPILSKLFDQHSGIPFPPMGDETTLYRFFAMLIVGASIALPFALPIKRVRVWAAIGLFFALVASSALYLRLEQNYVVTIAFPASEKHPDGAKAFITRGSQRSPDLKEPYALMKDDDLIRNTGLTDARLERVYTKESLVANRQKLFWAYVLPLVCLELLLGVIAKTEERSARVRAKTRSA
jgi:hypothetical protein